MSPALAVYTLVLAVPRSHAPVALHAIESDAAVWALNVEVCPAGQRNAGESECLAAVQAAAQRSGLDMHGRFKTINGSDKVPAGCSYSRFSKGAIFNHNLPVHPTPYQQVCISDVDSGVAPGQTLDRWTALGENWWQPFMDGFTHDAVQAGKAPPAYRAPVTEVDAHGHLVPKGDLERLQRVFQDFLGNSTAISETWTPDRLLALNKQIRCLEPHSDCPWDWTCHLPRHDENRVRDFASGAVTHNRVFKAALAWTQPPTNAETGCSLQHLGKGDECRCGIEKRAFLGEALNEYYTSIRPAGYILGPGNAPRRTLGKTLRPLATLYTLLAEIHPFSDGNSRTRVVLLNSELTRLGGHPVILPDFWRDIYNMASIEEVDRLLLEGWCAYEQSLATGRSPYIDWMRKFPGGSLDGQVDLQLHEDVFQENLRAQLINFTKAMGPELYDVGTDACRLVSAQRLRRRNSEK